MSCSPEAALRRMMRSLPEFTTADAAFYVVWGRPNQRFDQRQHSADVLRALKRLERRGVIVRQPGTSPIMWKANAPAEDHR